MSQETDNNDQLRVYTYQDEQFVMLAPVSPMSCQGCAFSEFPTNANGDCNENDYMKRYEGAPDCHRHDLVYVLNYPDEITEHHYRRACKRLGQPVTIHDLREIAKHDE